MSHVDDLAQARRWMNDPLFGFFGWQINEEMRGGARPATLSSAIEALRHLSEEGLSEAFDGDPANGMRALLQISNLLPGDTALAELG